MSRSRIGIPPGTPFGLWTVIGPAGDSPTGDTRWMCRCQCGAEKPVVTAQLRCGRSLSCGCAKFKIKTASGRREKIQGENHYAAVLTVAIVRKARALRKRGFTLREVADHLPSVNVTLSALSAAITGRKWKSVK